MKSESDYPRQAYAFMNTFLKFPNSPTVENSIYNRLFLNEYYYLKKITKNGISYINYDDSIFETDKNIILLTEVPLDSDLENILPSVTGFKENHIYFAYTKNLYNLITYFIRKRELVELVSFCEFLKIDPLSARIYYDKKHIFMARARFKNYTSCKYVGFRCRSHFIFNSEHKFIRFVFNNTREIFEKELFINFLTRFSDLENFSLNIDSIISSQREVLLSCVEKGLISRIEFDNLILSKEDFVMYPHGINF
jgi:hypothetical protein